ncbi:MAG: V-type ATP synthase subunit F [Promethearchaeota archaeon]
MKIVCVSDEETNILFGLIGIQGLTIKADNLTTFKQKFEEILEDQEIGVIILSETYLLRYWDYFKVIKLRKSPLIIEVPDMKAPLEEKYFRQLIEHNLGLRMKVR